MDSSPGSSGGKKKQDGQSPKGQQGKQDKGQPQAGSKSGPPPEGASGDTAPQKSKAQLKAERRAKQEAQRAAKEAKKAEGGKGGAQSGKGGAQGGGGGKKPQQQQQQQQKSAPAKNNDSAAKKTDVHIASGQRVPDRLKADDEKATRKLEKKLEKQQIPKRTTAQRKVGLFGHLHQYEREVSLTKDIPFSSGGIHPAILKLGLQYAEGVICGSNARCIALLGTLKQVIRDYTTPPQKELSRDLEARIKPYITFLTQCRPLSVSMGNAIKHIKHHISNIPTNMTDSDAKSHLYDVIDRFLKERILLAGEAISKDACHKIQDGDVIMVYACSSLIRKVLCDAHDAGKKFTVVVVDGRPKLEGKEMLRRLVRYGIKCSYILIPSASYVMREVTKVFLGAHALLANGYVMSRVGSSQVALLARSHNVPVLVCCETYKFYERVHTDSFVFNELGDPDDLVPVSHGEAHLHDWRDLQSLALLNLVYDVTPPELVSMVITEIGMVPCTSVPVVLRVKHAETEAT